ncbi:ribonuclease H-like domain-containing protein [Suillus spraguei]|nr:ribonuclease H-like domain-containing protein [Suillus spraguei]
MSDFISNLLNVLEPANATQSFSSSKDPTVWRAIPENMAAHEKFSTGLKNLKKWLQKTDDTDVYFICLALDPNYKLEYFDQYHTPVVATPQPILALSASSRPSTVQYGHSWMRSAILSHQSSEQTIDNPHQELDMYLTSPLEEVGDVVCWWDYLAIQGSSTPSEQAFSSSGITDHSQRNQLTPNVFKTLQLLKSTYRNGHVQAAADAAAHVEPLATVTADDLDLSTTDA